MTKETLRKILEDIESEYVLTDRGREKLSGSDKTIDQLVECLGLDNESLAEHLIETEICPSVEDIQDVIGGYSSAKKIIESFIDMMGILANDCGFYELSGVNNE